MDCSPPGSSVHGDSLGKNPGVGCHTLLQPQVPSVVLNLLSGNLINALSPETLVCACVSQPKYFLSYYGNKVLSHKALQWWIFNVSNDKSGE